MSEEFKARLECAQYAHEPLRSLYAIERSLHGSGIDIELHKTLLGRRVRRLYNSTHD